MKNIDKEKLAGVEKHLLEKIEKKTVRVPILPEVAGKVIYLVNNPDIGINEIVSLLERDPVIAAHVIKVANSPIYSPMGNIKSLKQASMRLGSNLLSEIALSVSLQSGIFILKGYITLMRDILKHTMATSLFTKEFFGLAQADFEMLYLAALFHTSGMPIVVYHTDEYRKKHQLNFNDLELNYLINKYHRKCCRVVLNKWNIDEKIIYVSTNFMHKNNVDTLYTECGLLRICQDLAFWIFDDNYDIQTILDSNELVDLNIHPKYLEGFVKNKKWIKEKVEEMTKY